MYCIKIIIIQKNLAEYTRQEMENRFGYDESY